MSPLPCISYCTIFCRCELKLHTTVGHIAELFRRKQGRLYLVTAEAGIYCRMVTINFSRTQWVWIVCTVGVHRCILRNCTYKTVARSNRSQPHLFSSTISFAVTSTRALFCRSRYRNNEIIRCACGYCLVTSVSTLGLPIAILHFTNWINQTIWPIEPVEQWKQRRRKSKELSIAWWRV